MKQDDVAAKPPAPAWTRAEDYVLALAFRRTARRARATKPRTQSDSPRFLLSTLPFMALIAALAALALAIIIAARPSASAPPQAKPESREVGTAPKGWFAEAEKEFHR